MINKILKKIQTRGCENTYERIVKGLSIKVAVILLCLLTSSITYGQGIVKREDTATKSNSKNGASKPPQVRRWADKLSESEGLTSVKDYNGKWGCIDKIGKFIAPCQWIRAQSFSEGLAVVVDDKCHYGFVDKTGKMVIPCQWWNAESFKEGLAIVTDDNYKSGYIDKIGKVVIPCEWTRANPFSNGYAIVGNDTGIVINMKGEKVF